MTQLLLLHHWWPLHRHQSEEFQDSCRDIKNMESSDTSFEVDDNDAVAIIAYVEAIEKMAIHKELVDSILLDELKNALNGCYQPNEACNIQQIANALLPSAKGMLNRFYAESIKHAVDKEDVCHCVHEDCEVGLLKSLTHVYVKNFISKYYQPIIAN